MRELRLKWDDRHLLITAEWDQALGWVVTLSERNSYGVWDLLEERHELTAAGRDEAFRALAAEVLR